MGFNMTAAYWDQWSHVEIMSMHGVEPDEDDTDLDQDDTDLDQDEQGCCSGCMSCLGLSWRD
jgi:hypothetical protein